MSALYVSDDEEDGLLLLRRRRGVEARGAAERGTSSSTWDNGPTRMKPIFTLDTHNISTIEEVKLHLEYNISTRFKLHLPKLVEKMSKNIMHVSLAHFEAKPFPHVDPFLNEV